MIRSERLRAPPKAYPNHPTESVVLMPVLGRGRGTNVAIGERWSDLLIGLLIAFVGKEGRDARRDMPPDASPRSSPPREP